MSQIIKIKRSTGSNAPSTLATGELAYSKGSDTFYVGDPATANTPIAISSPLRNNAGTLSLATGVTETAVKQLLNLESGVDIQAYDAKLAAIAGLATTDGTFIVGNGSTFVAESGATARASLGLGSIATQSAASVSITGGSISGITDLAIADGGTGASNATNARTNLGLAIGSDVQAYDAKLAAIAALAVTDGNFIVGNGSTFVAESGATARTSLGLGSIATQNSNNVSITGGSVSGITDLAIADGGTGASTATAARTNLGLAIGTNVLAYDANLQGFVNAFTLPTSDGTNGQVLTTDGSGNITFSSVSVEDVDVSVSNLTARLAQITTAVTIGDATDVTVTTSGDLVVTGDLTVNGTTTTVNSTVTTVDDPILTLGGDTAPTVDDEKDRGIEFRYYDTAARLGFFGYDNSANNFVLLTNATNTSEVFSGTKGTLNANLSGNVTGNVTGNASTATTLATARNFSLSGDVTASAVSFNGSGNVTLSTTIAAGAVDFAMLAGAAVQTSGETFSDSDTVLMTAAAVQDRIEALSTNNTGTVTSVGGTGTVNGITLTGTVTTSGNLTLGGTLGNITLSQLAGTAVQTGTEVGATGASIADNDTTVLTAAAVINFVEGKGYTTNIGDITSVQVSSTDGSITGVGTASSGAASFDLEVGTIDGGTYT